MVRFGDLKNPGFDRGNAADENESSILLIIQRRYWKFNCEFHNPNFFKPALMQQAEKAHDKITISLWWIYHNRKWCGIVFVPHLNAHRTEKNVDAILQFLYIYSLNLIGKEFDDY